MKDANEIELWMRGYIAKSLKTSVDSVDPLVSFDRLGLDSSSAVAMVGDLEAWLAVEVDPVAPYEYPTIRSLSVHISASSGQGAT